MILHMFLCVSNFNTCFIFMQTRSDQHVTAYKQQETVPEDVWARLKGVCEG